MEGTGAASPADTSPQQLIAQAIVGFGEMSFTLFNQILSQERSQLEQAVNS